MKNILTAQEAFQDTPEIKIKSSAVGWTCLEITPELHAKDLVVGFFRAQVAHAPGDLCERLCLALDELLGNAIEHGCTSEPKCGVEFTLICTERMVLFEVKDAGPGFELGAIQHAAVNNPPEDPLRHADLRSKMGLRPGGFGILMVKQIADELIYNDQGNEVVFVKYLQGPGSS